MTLRVLIDDVIVQTRAVLLENGQPVHYAITGLTNGPAVGARLLGQLTEKIGDQGDWLVALENSGTGYLSARRAGELTAGSRAVMEVVRAAEPGKNPQVKPAKPGVEPQPDWDEIDTFLSALPEDFNGEIAIGTRALWAKRVAGWQSCFPALSTLFTQQFGAPGALIDDAPLEALQSQSWPLKSGGRIDFGSVHGITVFDVNAASARNTRNINLEAAAALPALLRLAQIGGLIVIDFIDMQRRADQQAILAAFDAGFPGKPPRRTGWSKFGLVEVQTQRSGEGLPALLNTDGGAALRGPHLLCDTFAQASEGQPAPVALSVENPLYRWLTRHQAAQALSERLGLPVRIDVAQTGPTSTP